MLSNRVLPGADSFVIAGEMSYKIVPKTGYSKMKQHHDLAYRHLTNALEHDEKPGW